MYSTINQEKSVVGEGFIRILKKKIYKFMSSIPKNVYIGKSAYLVNEYDNTYHRTIKIKPTDIKPSTYIDYNVENNDKDPNFEAGNHVRISNYENVFAKGYTSNWSEEVFVINKVKNTVLWTYLIDNNYKKIK